MMFLQTPLKEDDNPLLDYRFMAVYKIQIENNTFIRTVKAMNKTIEHGLVEHWSLHSDATEMYTAAML